MKIAGSGILRLAPETTFALGARACPQSGKVAPQRSDGGIPLLFRKKSLKTGCFILCIFKASSQMDA